MRQATGRRRYVPIARRLTGVAQKSSFDICPTIDFLRPIQGQARIVLTDADKKPNLGLHNIRYPT
jgi:hypothetical protein